jgi:hypothetical protein
MKLQKIIFVNLLSFLFLSCSNDSSNDLVDPIPEKVSFSKNIKPIIDSNCIFCHTSPPQNGAPMPLIFKLDVQNAILNRGLIDRISRPQGSAGMMPFGGTRLPENSIELIKKWQSDGFLD